jgi:hypothetical protein
MNQLTTLQTKTEPPLQPPVHSDAGLVVAINDGPEDKPNFERIVSVICWDSTPGFVLCEDAQTGVILSVHRSKIEKAKMEAFAKPF